MHRNTQKALETLAQTLHLTIKGADEDAVTLENGFGATVETHRVDDHWIIAHWSDLHSQWQSSDVKGAEQGFRYAFARTLKGLSDFGVTHYKSPSAAIRSYLKDIT